MVPTARSRVAAIDRHEIDRVLLFPALLLILAGMAALASAEPPGLETPRTQDLPGLIATPVLADLDGDGFQEALSFAGAPSRIEIRRGQPGGFGPAQDISLPDAPRLRVRVADFDGNGWLDMLVALQSERFAIFLGDGASFSEPIFTDTGFGLATGMRIADFDLDGRPDVVASFELSETVAIWLGDGAGGLALASTTDVPVRPGALAVGDFDEDQNADVVIGALGTTRVAFGDGAGGFRFVFRFEGLTHVSGAGTGDFDGDGHLDFLVLNDAPAPDARLTAGYGDGAGSFDLRTIPAARELSSLEVGSLDGDRFADAMTIQIDRTSSFRTVKTWHGAADRTLAPEIVTGLANAAIGALGATLGDTDSDGHLDLVVTRYKSGTYGIVKIPGDPSGRFRYVRKATSNRTVRAAGQLDSDALLDLAATDASTVAVLRGDGFGRFNERAVFAVPTGTNRVLLPDVDGNGAADLLASSPESASATLVLSDGADGWLTPTTIPLPVLPRDIATGDLDHDGNVDLAVLGSIRQEPFGLRILRGDGAGGFNEIQNIGLSGATFESRSMAIEELNGDGFADIVVVAEEVFRVFLGDGSGMVTEVFSQALSRIHDVAIVDLEPDGFQDLVFIHGNGPQLALYRGAADGTYSNPYTPPHVLPLQSKRLAIADIDGDGRGDLVTRGEPGTIAVLPGSGGGSFLFPFEFLAPPGSADVLTGDLGFDGRPDVILTDGSVILNTTFELTDCRTGLIGRGQASVAENVLLVNGSAGVGPERVVSLGVTDPLEIRMDAPSSNPSGPARFALYLNLDAPTEATVTLAPARLGTSCFPTPPSGRGPLPDVIWNNTGKAILGSATKPSTPAPSVVASAPGGVGRPVRALLQGILADTAAPNGKGAITNAVEVRVQ